MAGLAQLNALSAHAARDEFLRCCGSQELATKLAAARPFNTVDELNNAALRVWWTEVSVPGWLEAFAAHPRIGDVDGLRKKFASTASWCEGEQGTAMAGMQESVLQQLAAWNSRYEAKFGHIFIVCATGKPAGDILAALQLRYPNTPHEELRAAAEEQAKITALRLDKLLSMLASGAPGSTAERRVEAVASHMAGQPAVVAVSTAASSGRPPITTHILDTATGRPASGVPVALEHLAGGTTWQVMGRGTTDGDGRCGTLLPAGHALVAGQYRMAFDTDAYYRAAPGAAAAAFYPHVGVEFRVGPGQTGQHFHIPLLISGFGYSTYRGS